MLAFNPAVFHCVYLSLIFIPYQRLALKEKYRRYQVGVYVSSMRGSRIWMTFPDFLDMVFVCVARNEVTVCKPVRFFSKPIDKWTNVFSLAQFVRLFVQGEFRLRRPFIVPVRTQVVVASIAIVLVRLLQTGKIPIGLSKWWVPKRREFRPSYRESWLKFTNAKVYRKRGTARPFFSR